MLDVILTRQVVEPNNLAGGMVKPAKEVYMVGKTQVPKWRYDFDCKHCTKVKYLDDGIRKGFYCMPTVNGMDNIHADEDRVVRCDEYESNRINQLNLFDS